MKSADRKAAKKVGRGASGKDKQLAGKGKASNALRIKDRAVELRPGRGVKAGTGVTRLRLLSAVVCGETARHLLGPASDSEQRVGGSD